MDDSPAHGATDTALLDPGNADPRALMQVLLPEARAVYIKAWEFLADAGRPFNARRNAQARVKAIAADHAVVVAALRERETRLTGDDLLNARHLADELDRHVEALGRLATLSPIGLAEATTLRPEALGCGKRYRDPVRADAGAGSASRSGGSQPLPKQRETRGRVRGGDQPFSDRGPKVPRDALGSSKHDSQLGTSLDETTRAKLEAMRQQVNEGDR